MKSFKSSGVWETFISGVKEGDLYKFEIKTQNGDLLLKSDPYAFYSEVRPNNASIVYDIDNYKWQDQKWMEHRKKINILEEPVSI